MTAAAPTERASTPVSHRAFPCLDGVRALAVTMVFVFHASAFLPVWVQRHFARYWIHLDLGVTIFFVLSGFLIYRPFVVEHAQRQVSSVRRYAIRRFARIFPAYWLALIGMAIWGGTNLHGAGDVIQNATLTFTYFKDPGIAIPQAWSLAAIGAFVLISLRHYGFRPTPGSTTADERLWTAMIAPMFAVLVVAPTALGNQRRGRLRAVLASRPIAFVGIVSYGIYLWH